MRKHLLLVFVAIFAGDVQAAPAPELITLDDMRTGGDSVKVTMRIEVEDHNKPTKTSLLDVYAHQDGRTLAVYRSDREAGQKVLVLDDQFWLFMPSSKRAIRITPMQKLLGDASVGDVSSLAWSQDYEVAERTVIDSEVHLLLRAHRRSLSYQTIRLVVDAQTLHPLSADFYLKSGKLAKHATFDTALVDNRWQIQGMTLKDHVQKQQVTHIYYDKIAPINMLDKWFTPSYLLRSAP